MIEQTLQSLGLTEKEALIYIKLLKLGSQPVSIIAKKAHVNRTTCYGILEELSKKGLVFNYIKKKITFYEAAPPAALKTFLKKEKDKISHKLDLFEQNLDVFKNITADTVVKPKIFFLEGLEGIRQTYQDTLTSKTPILGIESYAKISDEVHDFITKEYIPHRAKLKIPAKSILTDNPANIELTKTNQAHLRQTKIISEQDLDFNFELNIYDDKVAFIVFQKEHYSSFIIQNKIIAEGFKSVHNLLWNTN